jgi:hypothetical protein
MSELNTARVIAAYLEENGDRYDLSNSASIKVLAIDLQEALSPAHADIDREALRLANLDRRPGSQVRYLDTLNPLSQDRYRSLARRNLGA